jgi:hypothetical protein
MAKKEISPIKTGSEKFETEITKEDECSLFIVTGVENGLSIPDAYSDMKMIDSMLSMKRLHLAVKPHIKRTKAGYLRKGTDLYNFYMSAIEGRIKGQF